MLCHPPVLCRARDVAAGLSASRVSSFSKKKQQQKKNLLTGEFEVLVVAKLWSKEYELRAGSLCLLRSAWKNTSNFRALQQTVQSAETWVLGGGPTLPRLVVKFQMFQDLLMQFVRVTSEVNGFSILTSGLGTSVARCWLGPVVQFLHLSCCRWITNQVEMQLLFPNCGYFTLTLELFSKNYPNKEIYGDINLHFSVLHLPTATLSISLFLSL